MGERERKGQGQGQGDGTGQEEGRQRRVLCVGPRRRTGAGRRAGRDRRASASLGRGPGVAGPAPRGTLPLGTVTVAAAPSPPVTVAASRTRDYYYCYHYSQWTGGGRCDTTCIMSGGSGLAWPGTVTTAPSRPGLRVALGPRPQTAARTKPAASESPTWRPGAALACPVWLTIHSLQLSGCTARPGQSRQRSRVPVQ
jgi:hypothetical protein